MVFVPMSHNVYLDPDEFAKAIWDEKERRDKEAEHIAQVDAAKKQFEAETQKEYELLGQEIAEELLGGKEL